MVCDLADPTRLAFPLRRGLVWRRRVVRTARRRRRATCCPASRRCSTARCSARRRWKPLACRTFGCSSAATRWRCTADWCAPGCRSAPAWTRCTCTRRAPTSSSRSSAGGCTPSTRDDATKRYFTYRNRGYLQSQRGMRQADPAGVGAVRLVLPGDPARPGRVAGVDSVAAVGQTTRGSSRTHMTFTDAAAQSKTFGRAWGDLADGLRQARAVAAPRAGRTSSSATAARCSDRSGSPSPPAPWPSRSAGCTPRCSISPLAEHLPYVTLGLIIWNLINASILEGADVFVANEGLIKQLPTPLSVHVYRLVWRQIILFGAQHHHLRGHRDHLPAAVEVDRSVVHPGAGADRAELRLGGAVLRHPGHPLPRHQPAAVQPGAAAVLHDADHLERPDAARSRAQATWAKVIEFNPLLHYVDIVRAPLLGADQELRHWVVVIVLTIVGWTVTAFAMRQYRSRVPYWV